MWFFGALLTLGIFFLGFFGRRAFNSIELNLGKIDTRLGGLEARMAGLEADVGGLKADVGGLKADVGGLKADVGGLKADVGGLKADVGGLKADVGGLKAGMAGLEARIGDLGASVSTLQASLDSRFLEAGTRMSGFQTGLDKLSDSVSNLREDTAYIKGCLDNPRGSRTDRKRPRTQAGPRGGGSPGSESMAASGQGEPSAG
jgi:uncharacterized protein YoxC